MKDDDLIAGLALAQFLLTDLGWTRSTELPSTLADLHARVVRPLLADRDARDTGQLQALARAHALGGAALLIRLAETMMDTELPADILMMDLIDLAGSISDSATAGSRPKASGNDLLVEGADGRCFILTAQSDLSTVWTADLGGAASAADVAVDGILSSFPGMGRSPAVHQVCWPPEVPGSAVATSLPLALSALGEIFGLGAPPVLSAGDFDRTTFKPLAEAELTSRMATARLLGIKLLVPVAEGWRMIGRDDLDSVLTKAPRTLDEAASVIWGDVWTERKRAAHEQEFHGLGWSFVDWSESPTGQPVPDRMVGQVRQLERYCLDKSSPGSVAALGGTRQSGRSAVVRQLARTLSSRKQPWLVQVITGPTHELPTPAAALQVVTHAVSAVAAAPDQMNRRLLIIEDLQPIGEGSASAVLRLVAEKLRIIVIGVLEYSKNSLLDWNTDNMFVVSAVVSDEARRRFVEELAAADGQLDPEPAFAALDAGSRDDLRTLTQLMSGGLDVEARRSERFAELDDEARDVIVRTAALSLVSGEVLDDELDLIDAEDRLLMGIGPGKRPSTQRIASRQDCLAVLDLVASLETPPAPTAPRWRTINRIVTQQIEPDITRSLRAGEPAAVERLLGVRLFSQELCRTLMTTAADTGALEEWVAAAPLLSAVRIVGLKDVVMESTAQSIVEQIVRRVCRGPEPLSPAKLLTVVHMCQKSQNLLNSETLEEWELWLVARVDDVFGQGEGSPGERFAMLSALAWLDRDDAMHVVAARALDVLAGLTVRVEDYRLVRKVDQLYRKAAYNAQVALFPIDQENPVQLLLERAPDAADGIGVLLEAMNLKLRFIDKDWNITFPDFELALSQAIRTATASELALALYGIRSPSPQFATWLLKEWKDFPLRARELLRYQASGADAADLLNAVAKSNSYVAFTILDEGPRDFLVKELARRSGEARDAKGVGLLLSSAHAIEEAFGEGGAGTFSAKVAEALGVGTVLKLITYDGRTSIVYYVIKGVWDAQASYRAEVHETALDVVVRAIRGGRKHWGPDLALRLIDDADMGDISLLRLREKVGSEVLLSAMTSAPTAHARALFHKLGRALHADIPARFLRQWEVEPFLNSLRSSSADATLEVCVEVARTLASADVHDVGPILVAATGGAARWSERLRVLQPEALVQSLRRLAALDPTTARDVLDSMATTPSNTTIDGQVAKVLVARLRLSMFGDPAIAPGILRVVHDLSPELARDLWSAMMADSRAMFVFRGELQQMQNVISQSVAARDLARIGVTRGSPGSSWIDSLYSARVQGMHRYSSPRAIAELLRMIAVWDGGWGYAAVREVNVERIRRRLAHGNVKDAVDAVDLAGVMAAVREDGGARRILEAIMELDIERIAVKFRLRTLCHLLDLVREYLPEAGPRVGQVVRSAVHAQISRSIIVDERECWLLVGQAIRLLNQVGVAVQPVPEPRLAPNVAFAPAVAWAASVVHQPGWGGDALERAEARLSQGGLLADVIDRACVLSASGQGWARGLREGVTDWNITAAPFWLLRVLYSEAVGDPYVAQALSDAETRVHEAANRDFVRPSWDAYRLRETLDARAILRADSQPQKGQPPKSA